MAILFAVLFLLFGGALASLVLGKNPLACTVSAASTCAASLLGLGFSLTVLLEGATLTATLPLPLPLGYCIFTVDPIAAAFLLPAFLICALAAPLLPSRMLALERCTAYGRHGFFFNVTVGGMVLVLTAADGILFLLSWEIMSLAPFFLLAPEDRTAKDRYSGWLYLTAAHLGALPLLLLFALMCAESGGTTFMRFAALGGWSSPGLLFALALAGFGVKFAMVPLHVWIPEAYPAAPGHVAAVLAGALVNLGVYGLVRVIGLIGPPDLWWSYVLMAAGGVSAVLGVLFALAQPGMKRALAYSSVENMGIVCLALGAAMLAAQSAAGYAVPLLLGGGLLHMWNHSLFKSLYFLGASAVNQSTGSTRISQLGGLQKTMPFTGKCMAAASASIAGAPPFNGFVGELLLYMGFIAGAMSARGTEAALIFWAGLFTLAGVAGLALLCFTRLYGLIFLGAPRSSAVPHGNPAGPLWRTVLLTLSLLCLLAALAAPWLFPLLKPVLYGFVLSLRIPVDLPEASFALASSALLGTAAACAGLLALLGLVHLYRRRLLAKNPPEAGITWDCGFRLPSARIQYSGGSFAQFPAQVMRGFLRPELETPRLDERGEIFPRSAAARMEAPDWPTAVWGRLLFQGTAKAAETAKGLQHGFLNAYILYMLIALLAALVWTLGWS